MSLERCWYSLRNLLSLDGSLLREIAGSVSIELEGMIG